MKRAIEELQGEVQSLTSHLQSLDGKISHENHDASIAKKELISSIFSSPGAPSHSIQLDIKGLRSLVRESMKLRNALLLVALIRHDKILDALNLTELRQLSPILEEAGYWKLQAVVLERIANLSRRSSDARALDRATAKIDFFEKPLRDLGNKVVQLANPSGPIIHLVEKGLLDSGYDGTQRLHGNVRAQLDLGLKCLIVAPPGSTGTELTRSKRFTNESVPYIHLSGKNQDSLPLPDWFDNYVRELKILVSEEQPSVLHAHSSFLSAAAAITVGRSHQIPVVYEVSDLQEETWLANLETTLHVDLKAKQTQEVFGLPDAYTKWQTAERIVSAEADAIVVFDKDIEDLIKSRDTPPNLICTLPQRVEAGAPSSKDTQNLSRWAITALEIYRNLGAAWPHLPAREEDDWFIKASDYLTENPPPTEGWFVLGGPKDSPEVIMEHGWRYEDHPRIKLDEEIPWEKYPSINRSLAFWLQGWVFFDNFFAHERTVDLDETKFLIIFARAWNEARLAREQSTEPDESMAYYDMALALRTPRLLALTAVANHFDETRDEVPWMLDLLLHERQQLRKEKAFTPHTNHGFYTAAAQLHLEKYLPSLPDHHLAQAQANDRMRLLVESQFAADGGHLEHSPAYHRLLLGSFMSAVELGLITDADMVERLRRAQKIIGWMIQPDGQLVGIGDTEAARPAPNVATKEASTEWIITDGRKGRPTPSEMLSLPESGYVFVRTPQPKRPGERISSSYIAFQGGFHSRAHKHADDLSFVWFDRGQEILIDGGRWGYGPLLPPESPLRAQGFYYAAPERQYVESVCAHNTIEVDGEIHDRRRKPYGSAIIDTKNVDGKFIISASAPQRDYIHDRTVTLSPTRELVVQDALESSTSHQRRATVWFLLNGDFELLSHDQRGARFRLEHGGILHVRSSIAMLEPLRGAEDPLIGWRSTKTTGFVPAWSLRMQTDFASRTELQTTFQLLDD